MGDKILCGTCRHMHRIPLTMREGKHEWEFELSRRIS